MSAFSKAKRRQIARVIRSCGSAVSGVTANPAPGVDPPLPYQPAWRLQSQRKPKVIELPLNGTAVEYMLALSQSPYAARKRVWEYRAYVQDGVPPTLPTQDEFLAQCSQPPVVLAAALAVLPATASSLGRKRQVQVVNAGHAAQRAAGAVVLLRAYLTPDPQMQGRLRRLLSRVAASGSDLEVTDAASRVLREVLS